MKNVLIAHQSTIPHYRVDFYNALQRQAPSSWSFDVVFDHSELENPIFFSPPPNPEDFLFSTLPVKTTQFKLLEKRIVFQWFLRHIDNYDLIVIENAVHNLTYPIAQLLSKKCVLWGHGRDISYTSKSLLKEVSEGFKLLQIKRTARYLAYTDSVKDYLVSKNVSSDKITVLHNTIDIKKQRKLYKKHKNFRITYKKELALEGKQVLLFVGRITQNKRLPFLLEAFSVIHEKNTNVRLLIVGDGDLHIPDRVSKFVTKYPQIVDHDVLAKFYSVADLFLFPGSIGLGTLHAMCHDLLPIIIARKDHGPEVDYLTSKNSIYLEPNSSCKDYANVVLTALEYVAEDLRVNIWPSISHLTIENMAKNFIDCIDEAIGGA